MSGMSTGLNVNNPTIVSAFYNELLPAKASLSRSSCCLVAAAWSVTRSAQLRRAAMVRQGQARETPEDRVAVPDPEPAARRVAQDLLRAPLDF